MKRENKINENKVPLNDTVRHKDICKKISKTVLKLFDNIRICCAGLIPIITWSLGMQHHYFARYPTDEWHLANVFSLVYFSVVVCLRGLYHHILLATARALCQGQCTPHARFPLTEGGGLISGSPLLGRTGGVVELVLGSVFIIELDTGLAGIYFHRYYTEYDVCHKQNT